METSNHARGRPGRPWAGYLMFEAMVGGSVASTALVASMVILGSAHVESQVAHRRTIAAQLITEELELARGDAIANWDQLADQTRYVTRGNGRYKIARSVTKVASDWAGMPDGRDIEVEVSFSAKQQAVQSRSAVLRVYQP